MPWLAGSSCKASDFLVGYVKSECSLPHPVFLSPTPLVNVLWLLFGIYALVDFYVFG
jgi:hypothetical protein